MSSQRLKQVRLCGPHEYDHFVQPSVAGGVPRSEKTSLQSTMSSSEALARLCARTAEMLSEASVAALCLCALHAPETEFTVS